MKPNELLSFITSMRIVMERMKVEHSNMDESLKLLEKELLKHRELDAVQFKVKASKCERGHFEPIFDSSIELPVGSAFAHPIVDAIWVADEYNRAKKAIEWALKNKKP